MGSSKKTEVKTTIPYNGRRNGKLAVDYTTYVDKNGIRQYTLVVSNRPSIRVVGTDLNANIASIQQQMAAAEAAKSRARQVQAQA